MASLWRASVRAERRCSTISLSKSKACQPRGYAFEFHLASQIYPLRVLSAFWLTAGKPAPLAMADTRRKRFLLRWARLGRFGQNSLHAPEGVNFLGLSSLFPWAKFRKAKGAVKMHTLLDLHGNIPTFIGITDGKVHDVKMLDQIVPEAGAFYVMDRGYVDFERLFVFTLCAAFFVTRTKKGVLLQRRYSHAVDKGTGVRSDQTVILTAINSVKAYPDVLRRITYVDADTNKRLKFLTNNFALPALTIAQAYKCRWQVELFFKWVKQHLRIKAFFGTSENAVKTQIFLTG